MRFRETEGCACLFCGGNDQVQVIARDDGGGVCGLRGMSGKNHGGLVIFGGCACGKDADI